MRALIYARVSFDPKGGGRSVTEQTAECRAQCEREGWTIVDVFTDNDRSASRHAKRGRPAWEQVKQAIASGDVDILVTWEASRAQRDLAAYAELRALCAANGVKWSYGGTVYDLADRADRFRTGLDALVAENDADQTQERVQRAMRSNALRGRPHGKRLYGYRRVYDETSGELVGQVPEPAEADVIIEAARRFRAGESARSIANDFNLRGIRTPHNGKWDLTRIRRLLTNPAYNAKRIHLGEIVGDADWPAILDDDTFAALRAQFDDPRRRTSRSGPTRHLLAGIIRCGVCGGPGVCQKQVGRKRAVRFAYICRHRHCVARDQPSLDSYVTDVVLERLGRPDALDAITNSEDPQSSVARAEVAELRDRIAAATAEFVAGRLTAPTLGRIEAELLPRIATAERQIRVAGMPSTVADMVDGDAAAVWTELTVEQRREVIGSLAEVVILPTGRGRREFDPEAVRVEWRQA